MTDRRILFEMTGRRLNVDDFPADEESEQEEDKIVLLDDLLGYDDRESKQTTLESAKKFSLGHESGKKYSMGQIEDEANSRALLPS